MERDRAKKSTLRNPTGKHGHCCVDLGQAHIVTARNQTLLLPTPWPNKIVDISRAPLDREFARNIKNEQKFRKALAPNRSELAAHFTEKGLKSAIASIKSGKAAGLDADQKPHSGC